MSVSSPMALDRDRRASQSSVAGLRDRLLREARSERQRCLEVAGAAERRRAELRCVTVGTQTDPVVFADDFCFPGGGIGARAYEVGASMPTMLVSGSPTRAASSASVGTAGSGSGSWTYADEEAHAEALQTLRMLNQRGAASAREAEGRVQELEQDLRVERAHRQEIEQQTAHERSRKEAAQQQVLCLEYELDGKEAALQVAERALERRDADLQQAQQRLRAQEEDLSSRGGGDARKIRAQLVDRERQIELKDQHIARLLNVLRQHRSILVEEDSTICGSDRSAPMSLATTS